MKYACEQQLYLGELGLQDFFLSGEITPLSPGYARASLELIQMMLPDGKSISLQSALSEKTREYVEAVLAEAYIEETEQEVAHFREKHQGEGA